MVWLINDNEVRWCEWWRYIFILQTDTYVIILYTRNMRCMEYHSGPIVRWYMNSSQGWTNHAVMYENVCQNKPCNNELMKEMLTRMNQSRYGVRNFKQDGPIVRRCMNSSRGWTNHEMMCGILNRMDQSWGDVWHVYNDEHWTNHKVMCGVLKRLDQSCDDLWILH